MRWSKLNQIAQLKLAPSLAGRVRLETTHYRHAHDQEGRWGVVIDGEQVYGLGCIVADRESSEDFTRLREQGYSIAEANRLCREHAIANARHDQYQFHRSVWDYTQMSINDALDSRDAVIRALAYMDARTGKRRLRQLSAAPPATELERACLAARLRAEGIAADWMSTWHTAPPDWANDKPTSNMAASELTCERS